MKVRYPERVVYPAAGFRKRDVLDYYRRIAPALLPHLRGRPVTLKRYPDQAPGEIFYEKDAPGFTPKRVKTFPVWRRSGESQIHYILIGDTRTLLWAASVGTLEIHPFLARADDFDSPTEVVFDLDPGEGVDILTCAEVAFQLRDLLARLQLQSFAKVSGSKGIQVYVPLNTRATYSATQPFARAVAELLARDQPRRIVAAMEKAQRKNKVFIDWSQNADYKTTVGVYSLRAKRHHPYVSAPVSWEELERAVRDGDPKSLYFQPVAAVERVRTVGDLFAPVETLAQTLPEAFGRDLDLRRSKATPRTGKRSPSAAGRASEQGGRRTYIVAKRDGKFTLSMQIHDTARAWSLAMLPARTGASEPARPVAPRPADETWDRGTVELIEGNPAKGYLDLFFTGEKLKGEYILRGNGEWEFIRPKPTVDYASAAFLHASRPAQRRPEHTRPTVDGKVLPARPSAPAVFIRPMECLLVESVPEGSNWMYELKLDGYRIVAVKRGTHATIYSRRGTRFNDRFPGIASALARSPLPDCTLDGEIVALDERGRPSFQELQNSRSTRAPIVYYVFDLLNLGSRDLQAIALVERKQLLNDLASGFADPVRVAAVLNTDVASLVHEVKHLGLEGVVAKRADSLYESGRRSGAWVKYRVNEREELTIGGYLPGRTWLDALLVGRKGAGKLYFVKKVRNGFVPSSRQEVLRVLRPLRIGRCPFANLPESSSRRGAVDAEEMKRCIWVRAERKAEIEYVEQTTGGRLRHAAFRRLVEP